jgi:hypothetical protein
MVRLLLAGVFIASGKHVPLYSLANIGRGQKRPKSNISEPPAEGGYLSHVCQD